jgi:hypothetical protein
MSLAPVVANREHNSTPPKKPCLGFRVLDLGFRVYGLGFVFGIWGLGFMVHGLGFRV